MRGDPEKCKMMLRNSKDMHPFDNVVPLESLAAREDCGLVCFGNHQKKRPDNLIIGRTYNGKMLDMFELGIYNFKSMELFNAKEVAREIKPLLVFQGEQFEFSEKHQRLKNLFYGKIFALVIRYIELFSLTDLKEANIVELKRLLVFTAVNDTDI